MTPPSPRHPVATAEAVARLLEQHPRARVLTVSRYPEAVYVRTARCIVDGSGMSSQWAHAHNRRTDEHYGIICVRPKYADENNWGDVPLFAHEYAHLLAPSSEGHGPRWRAAITALGFPGEAERLEQRYASSRRAAARRAAAGE